ncbi:MAG TPA: GNAT family N-acetyltransferase [Pyrinomonadaceae bacterium]|nr:GNAT family N-acetyltransferase [Pyrinomonadaceae bacterium]
MLSLKAQIPPASHPSPAGYAQASALTDEHRAEALDFLAARPVHTVFMAGLIRDNGLVSPLNRGSFYGYRDEAGQLAGVALIGHITAIETTSDTALEAFAHLAQEYGRAHAILGESEMVRQFWNYYAQAGQPLRLVCREMLFEQSWPVEMREPVNLRRATLDDLEQVMPVHAQMAFEESGVNPLERDPEGFRSRTARRIEQGRVWVLMIEGCLVFKADVISETPGATYIEGVYVSPQERGKGHGLRCMSQLSRTLLQGTRAVCLLVNERNRDAHDLYRKAGYKMRGHYDTIFLS